MKELSEKQRKAIALMLDGNLAKKDIAKEVDVTTVTISSWLRNDDFLAELQKEQRKAFAVIACKAQKKMIKLLDANNDNIAFAAAKEILRLSGLDAPLKIEGNLDNNLTINVEVSED